MIYFILFSMSFFIQLILSWWCHCCTKIVFLTGTKKIQISSLAYANDLFAYKPILQIIISKVPANRICVCNQMVTSEIGE